jgi:hypothetical protein
MIENTDRPERPMKCNYMGASDVPAAGENPASPRTAGPDKSQPPKKRPLKRDTGRKACSRRGGNNHRPHRFGRPVTSAGQRNATPRSGVSCFGNRFRPGTSSGDKVPIKYTCQPRRLAVVSDLPIKRLTRATRRAIEIALTGQSALAAEQGSFAALFISSSGIGGGNSHRKGITRGRR